MKFIVKAYSIDSDL